MITYTHLFILIVIFIIIAVSVRSATKPRDFPPGPKWFPFVGCNILFKNYINKHGSLLRAASALRKEFSTNVLGLKLGAELVVILYGTKNIYRMYHEREFDGRPNTFFGKLRCLGKRTGITFNDGPDWKMQRQVTVKYLHNLGFGKVSMENEIQNETNNIVNKLATQHLDGVGLRNLFAKSVLNVLWKFVAGEYIQQDKIEQMLDLFDKRSKAFSMAGGWLNFMPWCRHIFPGWTGYKIIKELNQDISDIIEEAINKHKRKEIIGEDFIYTYLEHIEENKEYTEEQLRMICVDLLIAGSQTTSNTILFAILGVLKHENVQQNIFDEIHSVLGNLMPRWSDVNRLVYTSAFISELNRYYSIVPLTGPRRVLSDVYVDGYLIPKEATVLISNGDMNEDPEIWEAPREFKPERFIDEAGSYVHSDFLFPFGAGRRRCPGDSLAKCFIFITFVVIMQKFKVECENGEMPSDVPKIGILSSPPLFTADFLPRKSGVL